MTVVYVSYFVVFLMFFVKQMTAYEMRISDWSSDVCSADLQAEKGIALLSDRFPALKPGDRFLAARIGDLHFSWERHTEFLTYSFLAAVEGATLFDLSPFGAVPAWMEIGRAHV